MVSQDLNPEVIAKRMNSAKAAAEAESLKKTAHAHGYVYATSLYAVVTDKIDQHSYYRRIEILSNSMLGKIEVNLLIQHFNTYIPLKTYSLWLLDVKTQNIKLYEWWD